MEGRRESSSGWRLAVQCGPVESAVPAGSVGRV